MTALPNPDDTKGWLRENEQRVAYMKRLYVLDGRDNPEHPLHRLYTGLYKNRKEILIELDRMEQLR